MTIEKGSLPWVEVVYDPWLILLKLENIHMVQNILAIRNGIQDFPKPAKPQIIIFLTKEFCK
jgi:hypothetical protein